MFYGKSKRAESRPPGFACAGLTIERFKAAVESLLCGDQDGATNPIIDASIAPHQDRLVVQTIIVVKSTDQVCAAARPVPVVLERSLHRDEIRHHQIGRLMDAGERKRVFPHVNRLIFDLKFNGMRMLAMNMSDQRDIKTIRIRNRSLIDDGSMDRADVPPAVHRHRRSLVRFNPKKDRYQRLRIRFNEQTKVSGGAFGRKKRSVTWTSGDGFDCKHENTSHLGQEDHGLDNGSSPTVVVERFHEVSGEYEIQSDHECLIVPEERPILELTSTGLEL